ncbi:MAG: copper transport protein [Trizodia sp. TS-e1964]|nr:MAG: copper transport protein [Trizodia sp. TS-e1964]
MTESSMKQNDGNIGPGKLGVAVDGMLVLACVALRGRYEAFPGPFELGTLAGATTSLQRLVRTTSDDRKLRFHLANREKTWEDITNVMNHAVPFVYTEGLAFNDLSTAPPSTISLQFNTRPSFAIFVKELDRIDNLIRLSRNLLVTNNAVRDIAGKQDFALHVLELLDASMRISIRSFNNKGRSTPTQWNALVKIFKDLIRGCLETLCNYINNNEMQKLLLWKYLFSESPFLPGKDLKEVPKHFLKRDIEEWLRRNSIEGTEKFSNMRTIGFSPHLSEWTSTMIKRQETELRLTIKPGDALSKMVLAKQHILKNVRVAPKDEDELAQWINQGGPSDSKKMPKGPQPEDIVYSDPELDSDARFDVDPFVRGFLTAVPRVSDVRTIEVVTYILRLGISDAFPPSQNDHLNQMQAARSSILAGTISGRALVKEILVAMDLWKLRQDDMVFKMMLKIMEAIIGDGLMCLLFHSLGCKKDVMQSSQVVILKILSILYKQKLLDKSNNGVRNGYSKHEPAFKEMDHLIACFFICTFRGYIAPRICALMYLQELIQNKGVNTDNFYFTVTDMLRFHDGLYIFLDFIDDLCKNPTTKQLLQDFGIIYELIHILHRLNFFIAMKSIAKPGVPTDTGTKPTEPTPVAKLAQAETVSLAEKIKDPDSPRTVNMGKGAKGGKRGAYSASAKDQSSVIAGIGAVDTAEKEAGDEAVRKIGATGGAAVTKGLADSVAKLDVNQKSASGEEKASYPAAIEDSVEEGAIPKVAGPAMVSDPALLLPPKLVARLDTAVDITPLPSRYLHQTTPPTQAEQRALTWIHATSHPHEPWMFEWRNIKKMCLVIIGKLLEKNRAQQDLMMKYNGLSAMLSCMRTDASNPLLLEYAWVAVNSATKGHEIILRKFRMWEEERRMAMANATREAAVLARE